MYNSGCKLLSKQNENELDIRKRINQLGQLISKLIKKKEEVKQRWASQSPLRIRSKRSACLAVRFSMLNHITAPSISTRSVVDLNAPCSACRYTTCCKHPQYPPKTDFGRASRQRGASTEVLWMDSLVGLALYSFRLCHGREY